MAEQLIDDYRNQFGLSAVIVRPSIITPAHEEPFPGWFDSLMAANGFLVEVARGSVSSMQFHPNVLIDIIPVDIVCNHLIVAAWFDAFQP